MAFKLSQGYPDPGFFAFFVTDRNHFPTVTVGAGRVTETTVNLGLKAARLSVRVLDGGTGRPIDRARLELVRADDPTNRLSAGSSVPGHPGTLQSWVPSLTAFSVRVHAEGYQNWSTQDESDAGRRTLFLQPEEEKVLVARLIPQDVR